MRLAAILGTCMLLPWPCAGMLRDTHLVNIWQSSPQENAQSNSSSQNPSDKAPSDATKKPEQSVTPKAPDTASPPCPANSQSGSNVNPGCKPKASKTTKTKTAHKTHTPATPATTAPPGGPTKTVVRNGSEEEAAMELSPPVNKDKKEEQTKITQQLLAASDANLKKIAGRELNANQQDTVTQIKSYMEQAKGALEDDVQRAYNLALKAKLLSEELAGK